MRKAKSGDTVKIHYVGKLEDGTVFSSSTDRDPIEITVGEKRVAPFEQALVGMQPGESKTVHVPAEQAYGGLEPESRPTTAGLSARRSNSASHGN